jgi:ABC-type thiamin/hydroxymethylpyrimidine transport system permease subunit
VNWTWTCDVVTGVCTPSTDLQTFATLLLQGLWFVAGAIVASTIVLAFVITFMRSRSG